MFESDFLFIFSQKWKKTAILFIKSSRLFVNPPNFFLNMRTIQFRIDFDWFLECLVSDTARSCHSVDLEPNQERRVATLVFADGEIDFFHLVCDESRCCEAPFAVATQFRSRRGGGFIKKRETRATPENQSDGGKGGKEGKKKKETQRNNGDQDSSHREKKRSVRKKKEEGR